MNKLRLDPLHQPVRQKEGKSLHNWMPSSLTKSTTYGTPREVQYSKWSANVVVIYKKNGKWRVCIDITNLNKSFSKENLLLQHIDKVGLPKGHQLMRFVIVVSGTTRDSCIQMIRRRFHSWSLRAYIVTNLCLLAWRIPTSSTKV